MIPNYPSFTPLTLDHKSDMHPHLSLTPNGVSEYTFANLYLFRKNYKYQVSQIPGKTFILSGEKEGKKFFCTPCAAPPQDILQDLFKTHDYWKGISEDVLNSCQDDLMKWGIKITEDPNNFDYLYLRTDLTELAGKKFHKKRNLVNLFMNTYCHSEKVLTKALIPEAVTVLEQWRVEKGADGDYEAAFEAINLFKELKLKGLVYYVNDRAVGFCLGEGLAKGRMFAVHFEKGLNQYKGIYQYINHTFAASLPHYYTFINREQDLGDEGLRQAKMTYRPIGFVKKFVGDTVK
ncbi:conserved hypothetical protein [Treponema primitia ZAS-2]|uniref:Phosphatidylglycerol lysyltransferase C-terminal domain-containing protein n=1 Tax=Treponema primitia (strain ATCC BAA-887 / DSM 12427 / ZAS-2) TaxID=545694 RepID=F5YM22_TREPZ|nr:phosphatidylglycerol lysyltransferase domain-containing protein [Treponema primitia]AEF84060.1 conserved hypothetical protein [Treponema primitia ZAS-2]